MLIQNLFFVIWSVLFFFTSFRLSFFDKECTSQMEASTSPGHSLGIWHLFLSEREGIWVFPGAGHLITTHRGWSLIVSFDFMLRAALIIRGLLNHGGDGGNKVKWIQKKRLRIRGGLKQKTALSYWLKVLPFLKWSGELGQPSPGNEGNSRKDRLGIIRTLSKCKWKKSMAIDNN